MLQFGDQVVVGVLLLRHGPHHGECSIEVAASGCLDCSSRFPGLTAGPARDEVPLVPGGLSDICGRSRGPIGLTWSEATSWG